MMCPRRVMSGVSALRRALGGDTRQRLHAACTARADVADALCVSRPRPLLSQLPAPFWHSPSLDQLTVRAFAWWQRGDHPWPAYPPPVRHLRPHRNMGSCSRRYPIRRRSRASTSETHKEGRLSSGAVGSMGLCGARARGLMGHGLGGVINRTSTRGQTSEVSGAA